MFSLLHAVFYLAFTYKISYARRLIMCGQWIVLLPYPSFAVNEFSKLRLKVQIATEHAKWNEWDLDSSLS